MALCPKCIVGGLAQGTGMMPDEGWYRVELVFTPDSDGEVEEAERRVTFEGELADRGAEDGSFSAGGVLRGSFGVDNEDIEAPAVVEAYSRNGLVGLINLTVRGDSGRVTFMASITPDSDADDEAAVRGVVFMGWPEGSKGS
jgi:hypothetical protein